MKNFIYLVALVMLGIGFASCQQEDPTQMIISASKNTIELTVSTEAGAISGAKVQLFTVNYEGAPLLEGTTDSEGRFVTEELSEGKYIISVEALIDGREFRSDKPVIVTKGEAITVSIDPTLNIGSLALRIIDEGHSTNYREERNLLNYSVEVALIPYSSELSFLEYKDAWSQNIFTTTIENGSLIVNDLPEGRYILMYKLLGKEEIATTSLYVNKEEFEFTELFINGFLLSLNGDWEFVIATDISTNDTLDLNLVQMSFDMERQIELTVADTIDSQYVSYTVNGNHYATRYPEYNQSTNFYFDQEGEVSYENEWNYVRYQMANDTLTLEYYTVDDSWNYTDVKAIWVKK